MTQETIVEPTTETGAEVNDNGTTPVVEQVTLTREEVDTLIKTAEEATALAEKKSSDAENYRKGMMKYKSKLKDDYGDEDEEDTPSALSEDRIAQIVAEQLKAFAPVVAPKEDELTKANTTISELKNALASRVSTQVTSTGSNLDKADLSPSVAEKYYGPTVIAEMKRRFPGIDINKVYENEKNGSVVAPAN